MEWASRRLQLGWPDYAYCRCHYQCCYPPSPRAKLPRPSIDTPPRPGGSQRGIALGKRRDRCHARYSPHFAGRLCQDAHASSAQGEPQYPSGDWTYLDCEWLLLPIWMSLGVFWRRRLLRPCATSAILSIFGKIRPCRIRTLATTMLTFAGFRYERLLRRLIIAYLAQGRLVSDCVDSVRGPVAGLPRKRETPQGRGRSADRVIPATDDESVATRSKEVNGTRQQQTKGYTNGTIPQKALVQYLCTTRHPRATPATPPHSRHSSHTHPHPRLMTSFSSSPSHPSCTSSI